MKIKKNGVDTFQAKEVTVRLGVLEFGAGNADRFGDGQRLHLLEMDVQVNDLAGSATGPRTGAFELDRERDERTELVDENADTVDGPRFGRQTGRLLQILFAVGYEAGPARQRHLQLSLNFGIQIFFILERIVIVPKKLISDFLLENSFGNDW